jgi:hypothetical protein
MFHLAEDIHAVDDTAEHDVFPVEEGRGDRGDEELTTVAVWSCVLLGEG